MDYNGKMPDLAQKLAKVLDSKRDKEGTAASAAFIKDGELVAAFACGSQDGSRDNPATVGDLYNVGSVSKVYCAMAVMKLVEMGKVDLDTPITAYLPRFKMLDERYKQISLRMCLNHSCALPGTNVKNAFTTKWINEDVFYEQCYDYFSKSKLKADPGYFSVYCNDGFTLAEMVVAEISGMSFTRFVQEHIAKPAGMSSCCSGENNPENRARIREKGEEIEYVMLLGSGGIATDLTDCARFGYLFIDPRGVFTPQSIAETIKPQGASFMPGTFADTYGLGWDIVDLDVGNYDFGERVIMKNGGTGSFSSYLLVIPKYKLSVAMSATHDTKIDVFAAICELIGLFLEEFGINTKKPAAEDSEVDKKPIPPDLAGRISGIYLNASSLTKLTAQGDLLQLSAMKGDGWENPPREAAYDGRDFRLGAALMSIMEHTNNRYLAQKVFGVMMPTMQKLPAFPPVTGIWKSRVGNKYLVVDSNPYDLNAGLAMSLEEIDEAPGLLFGLLRSAFGIQLLPFVPQGDNDSRMFLDGPGSAASRDGFAPFAWEENGTQYLYSSGFTFVNAAALKPLESGRITADKGQQGRAFSITSGMKITVERPDNVRVFMMDNALIRKYDSAKDKEMPETVDGYILFVNDGPMDFLISVQ